MNFFLSHYLMSHYLMLIFLKKKCDSCFSFPMIISISLPDPCVWWVTLGGLTPFFFFLLLITSFFYPFVWLIFLNFLYSLFGLLIIGLRGFFIYGASDQMTWDKDWHLKLNFFFISWFNIIFLKNKFHDILYFSFCWAMLIS